jgi:hypothetical protein
MRDLIKQRIRCQLSSPKVVIYCQPDDGRTTETCSYVYISNIRCVDGLKPTSSAISFMLFQIAEYHHDH